MNQIKKNYFKMPDIKQYLEKLEIKFKTIEHPAFFTCEDADKCNIDFKSIHAKSLFLRGKKSENFYMIILPAEKRLEKSKFKAISGEKLQFGNEKEMKQILNVTPGSVSPFSLINDEQAKVNLIIDRQVWESEFVGFHPNINTQTLELTKQDFHKYINSLKNKLIII